MNSSLSHQSAPLSTHVSSSFSRCSSHVSTPPTSHAAFVCSSIQSGQPEEPLSCSHSSHLKLLALSSQSGYQGSYPAFSYVRFGLHGRSHSSFSYIIPGSIHSVLEHLCRRIRLHSSYVIHISLTYQNPQTCFAGENGGSAATQVPPTLKESNTAATLFDELIDDLELDSPRPCVTRRQLPRVEGSLREVLTKRRCVLRI